MLKGRRTYTEKLLIPIIFVIGIIPVIGHMYRYNANLSQFEWFPDGADFKIDYFLAWKMYAIILIGILMLLVMGYQYKKKKQHYVFENAWFFLLMYGVFVIMSALFSPYKYWVIRGCYEVFEPVWVLLAYMLFCYYTYTMVTGEQQIIPIFGWSGIGVAVVSLIGIFQYFGMDFYHSRIGQLLMIDPQLWDNVQNAQQFEGGRGSIMSSLYNPNYFTFYFGMVIPISLALMIIGKSTFAKLYSLAIFLMACFCLYAGNVSTAPIAILGAGLIVFAVLMSRQKKRFMLFLAGLGTVMIMLVLVLCNSGLGVKVHDLILGTNKMVTEEFPVQDVITGDEDVTVMIQGNPLHVSFDLGNGPFGYAVSCTDENGKEVKLIRDENYEWVQRIEDERYEGVQFVSKYEDGEFRLYIARNGWGGEFVKGIDETYYYVNPVGKRVKTKEIARSSFFNDDAMSLRGGIWNKVIPLLPKHFFVGSGANTFLFEYPQEDYVYRLCTNVGNVFDVKAHCWYLQQMVETGIIGTIFMLLFFGIYVVKSIRIYRRADLKESASVMGIGIFAAVLVCLFAGVVNDSNVNTSPVFWVVLGLGMAINRMIGQTNKEVE